MSNGKTGPSPSAVPHRSSRPAPDLSRERVDVARRARELLTGWLLDGRKEGWNEMSDSVDQDALEELAALGYALSARQSSANVWFEPDCPCERCRPFR